MTRLPLLTGADLTDATLVDATLRGAIFVGATLVRATLADADLQHKYPELRVSAQLHKFLATR